MFQQTQNSLTNLFFSRSSTHTQVFFLQAFWNISISNSCRIGPSLSSLPLRIGNLASEFVCIQWMEWVWQEEETKRSSANFYVSRTGLPTIPFVQKKKIVPRSILISSGPSWTAILCSWHILQRKRACLPWGYRMSVDGSLFEREATLIQWFTVVCRTQATDNKNPQNNLRSWLFHKYQRNKTFNVGFQNHAKEIETWKAIVWNRAHWDVPQWAEEPVHKPWHQNAQRSVQTHFQRLQTKTHEFNSRDKSNRSTVL